MPSVTQSEEPVFPITKKRRRDDADAVSLKRAAAAPFSLATQPVLLTPKRLRLDDDHIYDAHYRHSPGRRIIAIPYSRQSKSSPTQTGAASPAEGQVESASRTTTTPVLAPCHICRRRPTKKSDLDSFGDCEGCGMRTCYVCMRQCLGWDEPQDEEEPAAVSRSFCMEDADDETRPPDESTNGHDNKSTAETQDIWQGWGGGNGRGHRQTVCSRCCVERGADGQVICLGCLHPR